MGEADRIRAEYARRQAEIPAERYEPTAPAELYMQQSKERAAAGFLRRAGLAPLGERRVLEVGCGTGGWLPTFERWGARPADMAGVDLLEADAEVASRRLPGADIRAGDASSLPWEDGGFDLVVQSTVFSSILDERMRRSVAGEMTRVLAPGGAILWFDFFVDNPRNRSVRGVRKSALEGLFPGFEPAVRSIILAPPLARALAPRAGLAAEALERLRVLNTHLMALLRRL